MKLIPQAKKFLWVAGALALLVFALYRVALPAYFQKKLNEKLQENCKSCHLEFASFHLSLLPGRLSFENLHFKAGRESHTLVDAKVSLLQINASPLAMLTGTLNFGALTVEDPVVTLVDGDAPLPPRIKNAPAPQVSDFALDAVKVSNGTFTYVRLFHGSKSSLTIHKINGSLGALGSTPRLVDSPVQAQAEGVIEKSGRVEVSVNTFIFKRPLEVTVQVRAKGQNLSDLTPFFYHNDGIELKGRLENGRGEVRVRGEELHSKVHAEFSDFYIKFNKTPERDPVLTFFMNLGARLSTRKSNLRDQPSAQTREVSETRGEESLVSFILRGLKDAALAVNE